MRGLCRTCSDPVEGDDGAEAGVDVAAGREHGLVERGEQRAEDDHAAGRQDVRQRAAHALARVAEELRERLQVADLRTRGKAAVFSSCSLFFPMSNPTPFICYCMCRYPPHCCSRHLPNASCKGTVSRAKLLHACCQQELHARHAAEGESMPKRALVLLRPSTSCR